LELAIARHNRRCRYRHRNRPDCDRIGVAVKHEGAFKLLTNQIGALLAEFVIAHGSDGSFNAD
jgi:phosphomannomutase